MTMTDPTDQPILLTDEQKRILADAALKTAHPLAPQAAASIPAAHQATPAPAPSPLPDTRNGTDTVTLDELGPDTIVVESKRKPFNVMLVGRAYRAKPVKLLVATDLMSRLQNLNTEDTAGIDRMVGELGKLVAMCFGPQVAPGIMSRLKDPEDDCDIFDIIDLITQLVGKATPNPTSSPSA